MPHPNGIPTYEELGSMSETELVQNIDELIKNLQPEYPNNNSNINNLLRAQPFRDELVRREQDKSTRAMLCLTKVIAVLTAVMLIGLGIQIYIAVLN